MAASIAAMERASPDMGDDHPACLFPARFAYLKKLRPSLRAPKACPALEATLRDLSAVRATLVFTDAYMNNPASQYGHTLLRLDGAAGLLSHAVNYAADTGGEAGLLFALRGLLGSYRGRVSLRRYPDIIKQYAAMENRDLWEYPLNLIPAQLDLLQRHLWEMGRAWADYYFFTENCSYMLMEILDAANPDWRLARQFPLAAIPADTVRAALRAGAASAIGVGWRPSRRAELAWLAEAAPASPRFAYALAQYRFESGTTDLPAYRAESFAALQAMRAAPPAALEPPRPAYRPDQAHASASASVSGGARAGQAFAEVMAKPAYHDLMDDSRGMSRAVRTDFFALTARAYDGGGARLHEFSLAEVKSLAPRGELFDPISWQAGLRVADWRRLDSGENGHVGQVEIGAGGAWNIGAAGALAYVLAKGHAAAGAVVDKGWTVGAGAEAGVFADFGPARLAASAEPVWFTDSGLTRTLASVSASWSVGANFTVEAKASRWLAHTRDSDDFGEWSLGAKLFF